MPSNAPKTKSGTRTDFKREAHKMERAVRQMLARHREGDRLADLDQAQAQHGCESPSGLPARRHNFASGWLRTAGSSGLAEEQRPPEQSQVELACHDKLVASERRFFFSFGWNAKETLLQHWYVYHSTETMRHSYASTGSSSVYSTTLQPKLCFGDAIWVIEGDTSTPRKFALVDCFRYEDTKYPPFSNGYDAFKLRVVGTSLLKHTIPLQKEGEWFSRLHSKYITKQRFFERLSSEPEVIVALQKISGIAF